MKYTILDKQYKSRWHGPCYSCAYYKKCIDRKSTLQSCQLSLLGARNLFHQFDFKNNVMIDIAI